MFYVLKINFNGLVSFWGANAAAYINTIANANGNLLPDLAWRDINGVPILAPFWIDYDFSLGGHIYHG